MKKTKPLVCILSIAVLCLTLVLGAVGCKSTDPMQASYWYGKYKIEPKRTALWVEDIRESDDEPFNHYEYNRVAAIHEDGVDCYTESWNPNDLETVFYSFTQNKNIYFDEYMYKVVKKEFDNQEKTVKITKNGIKAGDRFYELDQFRYRTVYIYTHKESVYKDEEVFSRYVLYSTSDFDTVEKQYKALYYTIEWEIECVDGTMRKVTLRFVYKGEKL